MLKTILSTLTALLIFTVTLKAQDPTQQPQLPPLEEGFAWQNMPMVCAGGTAIVDGLTQRGFVPVNISLGRRGSDPQGEPVFLITYYISQDGNSTAATMNVPTSTDTCLMYITHDLVITQQ